MIDYDAIYNLQRQISYLYNRNAECADEIRNIDICLRALQEARQRLVQRTCSFEEAINLDNCCMDSLASKYPHRHILCVAQTMKNDVVGHSMRRNSADENFSAIKRELEKAQNFCEKDKMQLEGEIARNNQSIRSLNYSISVLRAVD